MRFPILALPGALAITLASCGLPTTDDPTVSTMTLAELSPAQTAALADGEVTFEEYDVGFRSFIGCVSDAGMTISEDGIYGQVYKYSYVSGSDREPEFGRCYTYHLENLDREWQMANVDISETTDWLKDCLREQGIEPLTTSDEVHEQFEENALDIAETCME